MSDEESEKIKEEIKGDNGNMSDEEADRTRKALIASAKKNK